MTTVTTSADPMRWCATHDAATGLLNRAGFFDALEPVLAAGRTHAVVVAHVAAVTEVEARHGRATADCVVVDLAGRLAAAAPGVLVARTDHATFAVVSDALDAEGDLGRLVVALAGALDAPLGTPDGRVSVAATLGAVAAPLHGDRAELLVARASAAARRAEEEHATWRLWAPTMASGEDRLALLAELERALGNDELFAVYQPKFRLPDLVPCGAEALVRWRHPVRGVLGPAAFVPALEASALLRPLTARVLQIALREWVGATGVSDDRPVAVNLPAPLLADDGIGDLVTDALVAAGAPPHRLVLELTERGSLPVERGQRGTVGELAALGVRVAIDDFGAGNASWAHLRRLQVDEVKIDRCFVRSADRDPVNRTVIDACVAVARTVGADVTAEGVETRAELATVTDAGCDAVQGFLLARPTDVAAAVSARPVLADGGRR